MSLRNLKEESLAEKRRQIEANPCHSEHMKSLTCLQLNAKDSDECQREVDNLLLCRTFWYEIKKFRQIHDIEPILPVTTERERLRAAFLKTGSLNAVIQDMKKEYNL